MQQINNIIKAPQAQFLHILLSEVKFMNNSNCGCKGDCLTIAAVAGIIIGVITTILSITAVITVPTAFLWVFFGIAVGFLFVLLLSSVYIRSVLRRCVCRLVSLLLLGILGTVLTSLILLIITFAATSIVGAIILGLLAFFFTIVIAGAACLVKCITECSDDL